MANDLSGKSKGGIATAKAMSAEELKARATKGAVARWGERPPVATHKGNFRQDFGIDVECYVLDDTNKSAVISQTGMGVAIGLSARGNAFPRFLESKAMVDAVGAELKEKLSKPFKYQWASDSAGASLATTINGYDATLLIEICQAIVRAEDSLAANQKGVAKQAHIILGASAKSGIRGLVYALAGYSPLAQEVIAAFKHYVQEEAKKYEKEFPKELYAEWQRLYNITPPQRGKNWKEMHLTVDHIYMPLAKSNGKLLEMLRSAKADGGDRNSKLFQFLNEVGARALRMQLGRVLEMAESSPDRSTYETKVAVRFGGQLEMTLPTYPIAQ